MILTWVFGGNTPHPVLRQRKLDSARIPLSEISALVLPMALLMATEVPSYYSEVLKRRGQHAGQTGQMNRKNCIQMQRLSGGLYGLQSQYLWTSEGDCDTFESSDPNGIRMRASAYTKWLIMHWNNPPDSFRLCSVMQPDEEKLNVVVSTLSNPA